MTKTNDRLALPVNQHQREVITKLARGMSFTTYMRLLIEKDAKDKGLTIYKPLEEQND